MKKKEFLETVMNHIKSKDAEKMVSMELEQHIKSNIDYYLKEGFSNEQAEQKAVEQMGSPLAIGAKFNKIYKPKLDWGLILLFLAVLGLGTLPLIALKNTYLSLNWSAKAFGISLGILIVAGLLCLNYKNWERKGWIFFTIGTVILLIASSKGNIYWLLRTINGRPYFSIGPFSTDTSIVLPLYLVAWASFFKNHKLKIWLLGILFIVTLLLFYGTINFPAVIIYFIMVLSMYLFSGRKHIFKTTILTGIAGLIGLTVIGQRMYPFKKERIYAFLDPQSYASTFGYIPVQIEKMLKEVTWGFQAIPKNGLIPEPHTDFVFLTLTYSYGWGFSLLLVAVLTIIVIKMALMTAKIKDEFGKLLIIGGLTIYSAQLLYNIGMVFGFLPITTMSFPFISYGIVPILINSLVIGIALSIYRRKNLIVT